MGLIPITEKELIETMSAKDSFLITTLITTESGETKISLRRTSLSTLVNALKSSEISGFLLNSDNIEDGSITPEKLAEEYATEEYVDEAIGNIKFPEEGGSYVAPTKLSELEEDEGHRTVTDDEKKAWSAKSDFSGKYEDLEDLPDIPSVEGLATEDFVKESVDDANAKSEEAKTTAEKALAISAIQPDYAENDVASPGHVLNREFYQEKIYDGLLTVPEYTGEEVCTNSANSVKFIKIADLKHNHRTIIEQLSVIRYSDGSERNNFTRKCYDNYSVSVSYGLPKVVATTTAISISYEAAGFVYAFDFPEAGLYIEYQSYGAVAKMSNIVFNDYTKPLDSKFLNFKEIDLPDDFEGYTNVIHLSEPIEKDWSKVKIWSADDGLVLPESISWYDFDYSLISETNHAEIGTLPSFLDLSLLPEESAGASIILMDESKSFFCAIQFLKTEGTFVLPVMISTTKMKSAQLEYLRIGDTESIIDFTATEEGWYIVNLADETATLATEEDLSLFSGTYENLKILDWGSLNIGEMNELGISAPSTEKLLKLFVKDFVSFVYPPGYYSAKTPISKTPEKGVDYFTEEDKAELVSSVLAALPTWEGGSY